MRVGASGEPVPVTKLDPRSTYHKLPQFRPMVTIFFYAQGSWEGIYLGTLTAEIRNIWRRMIVPEPSRA